MLNTINKGESRLSDWGSADFGGRFCAPCRLLVMVILPAWDTVSGLNMNFASVDAPPVPSTRSTVVTSRC